jgi:hypothetical protein
MTEPRDPLHAGLAAAFGPDSAAATVAQSVVRALGFPADSLSRVQFRDPGAEPVTPVLRPGSPEMPTAETADQAAAATSISRPSRRGRRGCGGGSNRFPRT